MKIFCNALCNFIILFKLVKTKENSKNNIKSLYYIHFCQNQFPGNTESIKTLSNFFKIMNLSKLLKTAPMKKTKSKCKKNPVLQHCKMCNSVILQLYEFIIIYYILEANEQLACALFL